MRVAVICRQKGFEELRLKLGWWSYPVPGLEWQFFPRDDGYTFTRADFAGFDLIVREDWAFGHINGRGAPLLHVIVDANTSERRRAVYRTRAREADLLLIDQDELARYADLGKPCRRWRYAVNEGVFKPLPKAVDVACHLVPTHERVALMDCVQMACARFGWTYSSGVFPVADYAAALGAARVVVHLGTHPQCRSHRVFDALAAGACLLTSPLPDCGDGLVPGVHYQVWQTFEDLLAQIAALLKNGAWNETARAGRSEVLARHTWRTRAAEFVRIVREEGLC